MLASEGLEATIKSIESDLPQLSKIGSKDDMSVAFIYNREELKTHVADFIQYQIDLVCQSLSQTDDIVNKLQSKIDSIKSIPDEKTRISLDYARKDIQSAQESRIKLLYKYDVLMRQLSKEISNTIEYDKEE